MSSRNERLAETGAPAAPRTPLSKERVLRAAIEFADERGVDALSMRKLAQELGVEAMSLYNHVANKDEILDGIVDLVAAEVELPAPGTDWKAAIRQIALSTHDALVRHPWAGGLWMRPQVSVPRLSFAESLLRSLREGGFSADLTYSAYHTLQGHIFGFTRQELNLPLTRDELAALAARFVREIPADTFPYLVEHVHQHMDPNHKGESGFELGLDLILEGLERVRDGG